MRGRPAAALLALALALCVLSAPASGTDEPTRTGIRNEAYAYLTADQAYLIIGRPVEIFVALPGEPHGYTYSFAVFHAPGYDAQVTFQGIAERRESGDPAFSFTPAWEGQYLAEATVYDADGISVRLQSQPFYAYAGNAENNLDTLPGRARAILADLRAQSLPTQYDQALWLHDWLIHHADYDTTQTIHTPEGVLLYGRGVCESYALAYDMLLRMAGMDSIYVTGTSRGVPHAWNLAHLDGAWTYIDPTWDDPVGGGQEHHGYFGLTSALMARDHDASGMSALLPEADSMAHNWALRNGVPAFTDADGLDALLAEQLQERHAVIDFVYHGADGQFPLLDAVSRFLEDNGQQYHVTQYAIRILGFAGRVTVTYRAAQP